MRHLPPIFLARMQAMLGADFAAFLHELETQPRHYAIRANTLKITRANLAQQLHLEFDPVLWSDAGLYATRQARLGAHAMHHAGAYYVQEPSAQAVALALGVTPNSRVLDLCAAPGGKSTHLAALMQNQGVLVANEISASRAKALAENLERLGCIGMVTNEEPNRLAQKWGAFFDFVLVDAPCSGEGMFRKHDAALEAWSEAHVQTCGVRQSAILGDAAALLQDGGRLVYSTCTFAPEENEQVIGDFLTKHPEFSLEPLTGFEPSSFGSRLMPHKLRGEGHFIAKLRKSGQPQTDPRRGNVDSRPLPANLRNFLKEFPLPDGIPLEFRQEIQVVHPDSPNLDSIKVVRAGIPVAHSLKNRLEPHHGLSRVILHHNTLELEPSEVSAYLRGETISSGGTNGWVLLRTQGLALGWGKRVGSTIKNHYPKHLRGATVQLEE